ncbi:response regulator [Lysobacter sp. TAB13]|uniref:response regulator transcription factor n=1 Tax=Lysobacter sp. TAB13 TaxID=3233065 RepID=UPI003F98B6F9
MPTELLSLTPALIVEDDPATQRRLASIVREVDPDAEVTIVGSLAEAYDALSRTDFAIALVDVGLPDGNGRDLVARLHARPEQTPALVISSFGHEETVLSALQAGAVGYLLKEREDIELVLSLKSIQRGGAPIDPLIARRILELLPGPSLAQVAPEDDVRLSARELEVLQLLARGCSNREIADLITLSRLTVEGYIKAVYRKLAVGSRTAAVFEAQKLGLLS